MAVTFVAAGTYAHSGTAGTITPGLPAGLAQNDIMLLLEERDNSAASGSPVALGWAFLTGVSVGTGTAGAAIRVYWKRAGAVEVAPGYAWTGNHVGVQILAYRGCTLSGNPYSVTGASFGGNPATTAAHWQDLTTDAANQRCVFVGASSLDTATPQLSSPTDSTLTSITIRCNSATTDGNGGALYAWDGVRPTIGTTNGPTATLLTAGINGGVGFNLLSALTDYTITAFGESYAIAGQAALFNRGRIITADAGTYAIAGQAASLVATKTPIAANTGAYVITGYDAGINHGYTLTAAAGSYAITGNAADIVSGGNHTITAAAGTYTITGNAATLDKTTYLILAAGGAYTISGQAALLTVGGNRTITADAGVYAIAGQAASLVRSQVQPDAAIGGPVSSGGSRVLTRSEVRRRLPQPAKIHHSFISNPAAEKPRLALVPPPVEAPPAPATAPIPAGPPVDLAAVRAQRQGEDMEMIRQAVSAHRQRKAAAVAQFMKMLEMLK